MRNAPEFLSLVFGVWRSSAPGRESSAEIVDTDRDSVLFQTRLSVAQDKAVPVGMAMQTEPAELLDPVVRDGADGPLCANRACSAFAGTASAVGVELQ